MAQVEDVVIARVDTGEAVKSIADLKSNVSVLKKELEGLDVGSEEYQKTLNNLKLNQNALKDAMYATSSTMAEVTQGAAGMGESYNSLVHRMAALKEEFRSTNDTMRRADLGKQINDINTELKKLDAMQGNYQRNVGDYVNSFRGAIKDIPKYADAVKKPLEEVDKTMKVMSGNPLLGIITLLFPLIQKITEELKGNSTAIEAIDKGMQALKPVMDFFSKIVEKLAVFLADIVTKVTEFVGNNGLVQKVITGIAGIGNAIVQMVLTPFKAVIDAVTIFKEKGIKGFKEAGQAVWGDFKEGFSFKQSFNAGKEIAEGIISGASSKKKEVKEEVSGGVKEGVDEAVTYTFEQFDKALAIFEKKLEEARKLREQYQKEFDEFLAGDQEEVGAEIDALFDQYFEELEEAKRKKEEFKQNMVDSMYAVTDSTGSILGSIADLYEANSENDERAAKNAKALRIASATIDTISGAIGAFMQSVKSTPPPFGAIIGAAQAAAVTAAGVANIAKIKSTQVSKDGATATPALGAVVSAPVINTGIPQTSLISTASQEDRLNRMASDQRVWILQSDIEGAGYASRARVAESAF